MVNVDMVNITPCQKHAIQKHTIQNHTITPNHGKIGLPKSRLGVKVVSPNCFLNGCEKLLATFKACFMWATDEYCSV